MVLVLNLISQKNYLHGPFLYCSVELCTVLSCSTFQQPYASNTQCSASYQAQSGLMQLPAILPCPSCDLATPREDMARHRATVCPQARQRTDADMPLPVQCTAGGTCTLHLVRRPLLSLASVYRLPLNFPEYSYHCPLPRLFLAITLTRHSGLCSPPWTPGYGRRE